MPKISVIIPTYNASNYIQETINSILEQDYKDFEIIIVDDCSSDNTKQKVNEYNLEKITFISLEKNHGGPSRPRNIGIKNSKGKYIALCDSDDLFCPGRLSTAMALLEKQPHIGMVFTGATKFNDCTGELIGNFHDGYDKFWSIPKTNINNNKYIISSENAFEGLFFENFIMPSGVTINKEIFLKVGYFDESLKNGDDWDMWFRITKQAKIGFIDEVGFKYRIRSGSVSKRGAELAINRIKVLKKLRKTKLPKDLYNQLKNQLSNHYFGLAYKYKETGMFRLSFDYFKKSLKEKFTLKSIKGLISLINIMLSRKFRIYQK
ncbi:glycosyl transferase, family II [Desulfosarcina variabilis str. Montpellier]|uniref:glycosyltransferase family 2 protein n=1 Tax=Desulfosarcina variabilis TaxID=2300 RepID=UPI003AFB39D4